MGVFDRLFGRGPEGYKARAAERLEMGGDLEGAARAFLDAELPDEAARVLLLRADAEPSVERRMAFCAQAARIAKSPTIGREALGRKARLRFDVLRARGNAMKSELLLAAQELEAADENEVAADAYVLAEDREGEIRALTAAGLIDRLEERLRESQDVARKGQAQTLALKRIQDLDRGGERREALRVAEEARNAGDGSSERVEEIARVIRAKLLRGPLVELKEGGAVRRYALGSVVTVGRGESTIVVGTRSLSRVHLRVLRQGDEVFVEDAETRNGTFLAGARIGGRIPLGQGLLLKLGGDVPCRVAPTSDVAGGGVVIEVGGLTHFAPLGDLRIGAWRVSLAGPGGDDGSFVMLESSRDAPAFLGELEVTGVIELAAGDAVSSVRGGPARVVALAHGSEGDG
jgi:hypothetical protein